MRRKYSQIRAIKNGKKEVRGLYQFAVDYFAQKFNLPKEDFPKLRITRGEKMSYNQPGNYISIGDEEFIQEVGDTLGEELGHYVRSRLRNRVGKELDHEEAQVDEFFGFMGSKILYHGANKNQRDEFFEGERTFESDHEGKSYPEKRKEILERSKKERFIPLKQKYLKAEKQGDKETMQQIYEELERRGYREHVSELMHVPGYRFASQFNVSDLGNLKRTYSLEDRKVRKKFFRRKNLNWKK